MCSIEDLIDLQQLYCYLPVDYNYMTFRENNASSEVLSNPTIKSPHLTPAMKVLKWMGREGVSANLGMRQG